MSTERTLVCSFCGRNEHQVAKLVAGRAGFICNTCAATAHRIMSEPSSDPSSSGAWSSRLFARIKRVLRHRGSWDLLSAG